jgi:hypothetical protein
MHTVESEARRAREATWSWIWQASSRVGETITARGPEGGRAPDSREVMCVMQGSANARVLPEPVSATPMTSRPEKRCGQAAD